MSHTKVVTATFTVRNTHPVQVSVGPLSKGCSCSEAVVIPDLIPTNGTAEVRITWQLRGKRGEVFEYVSAPCLSGGALVGQINCRLKANVHGEIDAQPGTVELSPLQRQAVVRLKSRTARPFKLTGIATNHPTLKAAIQAENELLLSFEPDNGQWQSGRLFARVDTNLPEEPEVFVWVRIKR